MRKTKLPFRFGLSTNVLTEAQDFDEVVCFGAEMLFARKFWRILCYDANKVWRLYVLAPRPFGLN